MPQDHPDPSTSPADRQPQRSSPRPSPIREALLFRFSDPEDAAALRRVGSILEELLDSSEQRGPEADDNQVRPAVLAVVQDLLADAANLTAIAERRAWDGDLSSEEFALAMRADAWADQVKALAASFLQLVAETPTPPPPKGCICSPYLDRHFQNTTVRLASADAKC